MRSVRNDKLYVVLYAFYGNKLIFCVANFNINLINLSLLFDGTCSKLRLEGILYQQNLRQQWVPLPGGYLF